MPEGREPTGPVVVGIDGSDASIVALGHAVREAAWRGVDLHVVHALDVTSAVLHLANDQAISTRELAESDRAEIWKRAAPTLATAEVNLTRVNRDGNPGSVLCDYCQEVGASVLVVGPRGRGRMIDALLGSTAHDVVRQSKCNVLVVKSPLAEDRR